MNKYLFLLLSLLLLTACNIEPNVAGLQKTPEDAAKAFFEALSKKDQPKAEALATELTQKQLKLFLTDLKMGPDEEIAEKEKAIQLDFKSISCQENAGKMICKICCNADGAEAEVEMAQVDGKWFVNMNFGF